MLFALMSSTRQRRLSRFNVDTSFTLIACKHGLSGKQGALFAEVKSSDKSEYMFL